jgi:acetyltransferase-like isoleucine patch superfamily enzyme
MIRFIDIVGENNIIKVASGVYLYEVHIAIKGNNNKISLGRGAYHINIEFIGDNNIISIGNTWAMTDTTVTVSNGRRVIIGDGCVFSAQTTISTTDHHPIYDQAGQRVNPDQDVLIGDRVWLGRGVDVLKGTVIESDVVIGARSVVTGTIPANSVAAGVPARVIKRGTTWRAK